MCVVISKIKAYCAKASIHALDSIQNIKENCSDFVPELSSFYNDARAYPFGNIPISELSFVS